MQADVDVGYSADDYTSGESMRSGKLDLQLIWCQRRDHFLSGGRKSRLSGGVGAGTRAVTPATRRSGAGAAAYWGSPSWRAGPTGEGMSRLNALYQRTYIYAFT